MIPALYSAVQYKWKVIIILWPFVRICKYIGISLRSNYHLGVGEEITITYFTNGAITKRRMSPSFVKLLGRMLILVEVYMKLTFLHVSSRLSLTFIHVCVDSSLTVLEHHISFTPFIFVLIH